MRNHVAELIAARPNDWLEHLVETYEIEAVRDGDRVSLKYNQIQSPMHLPIVQQCRGMVVDTAQNRVLAWGYNKFWNFGESQADQIDWTTAKVLDKLDGSLMQLYWYEGKKPPWWRPFARARWRRERGWNVSSSGHPTAGGSFGAESRTFRDAFLSTFAALGYKYPPKMLRDVTFMLELCDTPNRIVVRHDNPRLVLHGARYLPTGQEMGHEVLQSVANELGWELVRVFPITSVEECVAAAAALDPIAQEGFVVVDAKFKRVKIKSPRYVQLHLMKGEATPRRAIQLWQSGETSELLTHFPEFAPLILPTHDSLDKAAEFALRDYSNYAGMLPDRKAFAAAVKSQPYASVCFKLIGTATPTIDDTKAIMRRHSVAALERMLGMDEETKC